MVGKFIDRLFKKVWSDTDIEKYVGKNIQSYLTYAQDDNIRKFSASGGSTTAILIHGLEHGFFDGALVCKTVMVSGKVRTKFEVAVTKQDILEARGSKYVESNFTRDAIPQIKNFSGKVAVVGLPCDLSALTRLCRRDRVLASKVSLTIALVCGHNSRTDLIDEISTRLEKESGKKIVDYRFRVGHWRGFLEADLDDGSTIRKPTKFFNDYQNLHFFSERKCMSCHDHYGYVADITVGDVWLFKLKDNPIKHTGIIVRTNRGKSILDSSTFSGDIHSEGLDVREIMDGQSRIGPSHYNVTARHKVGKILGIKVKDTVNEKVSVATYINTFLSLLNIKVSSKPWGKKIIFSMPRIILKAYLYFKKALESYK
ncbi:Coenzyme F420 hydrogenase/dehydrogenase, beta subunit C-terminal domain [Vibrio sp. WJH972]